MSRQTLRYVLRALGRSLGKWGKLAPLALGLGAMGCGGQHLKLSAPDASPGSSYECWEGRGCAPATGNETNTVDQSGTKTFELPPQCAGHVQMIVVLEADSPDPVVYVTCAAAAKGGAPTEADSGGGK